MQLLSLSQLLARCRDGDHDAAAEVVRRFQDMALGLANALLGDSHLAEDAVQSAFIRAFTSLADLRDDLAFPGWFRQIVRSECHAIHRRRDRTGSVLPIEAPSPEPSPADDAERAELHRLVRAALASLPPASRDTAALFYLDQRSCEEVADALNVPPGTVKRRLYDARAKLRESLLGLGEPIGFSQRDTPST